MASMNNWLAFSLSPQEQLPPSQSHDQQSPSAVSRLISAEDVSPDCYGFPADSSSGLPLAIPTNASYGILEAFNRSQSHHHPQDWSMNGSSSELLMLVGSSSNNQNNNTNMDVAVGEPKLEDFLGGHSFSDNSQKLAYDSTSDYMFSNCSLQLPTAEMVSSSNYDSGALARQDVGANSNGVGISMIKTWLRNQPGPTPTPRQAESKNGDVGGGAVTLVPANNSQSLSLSMSTGSQSSSLLPLMASEGSASVEGSKQKGSGGSGLDEQSGAIEAVSRKSIDTFGQRTSIYRGVTRHRWTGRYEAHLWDNSCKREGQTRKGRQVYLALHH